MGIDRGRAAAQLKAFEFAGLFNELGWDHPRSRKAETIILDGETYSLSPVAEKRGVRIFHCDIVPDRAARQRIDREITKLAYEHLIIFTNPGRTRQVWQWVSREKGKPAAFREHVWLVASAPEALIQKLDHIAFGLDEEEGLTLAGTTLRLRDAFDRERITKRFYGEFETQHKAFLEFIQGLEKTTDRQWYASLMLNRLMFIYFIQKKGFLDSDPNYLRERLKRVRQERGDGQFHSFYRLFLRTLFHGGLATPVDERDHDTRKLLGKVPYLNGGLFEPHALEADGNAIEIADEAFDAIFKFFDDYDWTLDTRPIARNDGKEINPDVLGHIFEKYINNKQMGAYYTKEDITDYITRNTVIPWLFQNAADHDKVAFEPAGPVWRMVAENPDAYIYPSIRKGVLLPLPDAIAAGMDDIAARGDWNRLADADFGLPTETWREVVARRQRYQDLRTKASSGSIVSIEDFVTLNLDIGQFALDAIQYAESSDLVKAFWKGISAIKVLDPACGSGAFLFAALNVLHSLYEGCLVRMQEFVDASPPSHGGFPPHREFREVLDRVAMHPGRDYFIYKSIIIANLYGVDIMDEAVEICKLRLFLKLAAQLESVDQIEPLPDIDFNIRPGNSVLGFKSIEDVKDKSVKAGFEFNNSLHEIQAASDDLDHALKLFRHQQMSLGGRIDQSDKREIVLKRGALRARLDSFFIDLYAPPPLAGHDPEAWYSEWLDQQSTFHWVIEFHDIITDGGFSAIIGNPPYVEIDKSNSRRALVDEYETCLPAWSRDEDLYTLFIERSLTLVDSSGGSVGLIVPLSVSFSTKRPFVELRRFVARAPGQWHWSHFDRIPSALFGNEVRTRCSIGIFHAKKRDEADGIMTTSLQRWSVDERDSLFETIHYAHFDGDIENIVPRVGTQIEADGLQFLFSLRRPLGLDLGRSISATSLASMAPDWPERSVFVAGTAYNWLPAWRSIPETFDDVGRPSVPARAIGFTFANEAEANLVFALLCSSLGYWWWAVASDGFNLKKWLVERFPIGPGAIPIEHRKTISDLGATLKSELERHYVYKDNQGRKGNFYLPACARITTEIDEAVLAALPGLDRRFMASIQDFNTGFASNSDSGSEDDGE